MTSTAERLVELAGAALGGPVPLPVRAWDGSRSGPTPDPAGPVLVVNSRRALRRLVWSPNEIGLAEAYLSGDIDIDGDLTEGLAALWSAARAGEVGKPKLGPRQIARMVPALARLGALGGRPPGPGQAAALSGRRHSRERDRAAIAHHYDLSNDFYELLLDPSMAYSSAYYQDGPGGSLADAQTAKLDLICRKLGLHEGARHLDIGCGWGSLICHAAEHYGTRSTGITLSRQQFDHVSKRVARAGLADRVDVRHADYRELRAIEPGPLEGIGAPGDFDAVSTVEMGEHVGDDEYPAFARIIFDMLRPCGRALVQQMSRGAVAPGGGGFIETYIAPDMHMKPVGTTVGLLADAGLEVRDVHALREHYTWTIRDWLRTFEGRIDEVTDLIGHVGARVWRLYLVGSALAFEQNRMGVDQILAVRPALDGDAGFAPSRKGWEL
ncbi:class I SAM-dependent methyltransferase [Nakamurella silvestris]|nr:class I SAM-dependent methyltransferase [Nakamurella silvestris]